MKGPCSVAELSSLRQKGHLSDGSLVCPEGSQDWVELRSVLPHEAPRQRSQPSSTPNTVASKPVDTKLPAHEPVPSSGISQIQAVIIILLLAGILVAPFLHTVPISPPPAWEYRIETIRDVGFTRQMNEIGAEGWEVVFARRASDGSEYHPTFSYEVIFKRPKQQGTK